jgi:phosphohistidine phosphatase
MKKLILVRHAKSDWPEETEDFDRPLADKGLEDAMNMSRFLKNNNISSIISYRARQYVP